MIAKNERKYLLVVASLIIGLFMMEYFQPKPIDWRQTFSKDDKIPFGAKALYEAMPTLFEAQEVISSQRTFYEWQAEEKLSGFSSAVLINESFTFGKADWSALSEWLSNGGVLFMASTEVTTPDTLDIDVDIPYNMWQNSTNEGLDSVDYHQFANPQLQHLQGYLFKKGTVRNSFQQVGREDAKVLAINGEGVPTFLLIPWGNGRILWHCNPVLFTNYNLLAEDNHEYIAKCLSYLPADGNVLWDEYYKVGRTGAKTPLRMILSKPSLAWAWYLSLFSIFIFIIFNIKRKQRAIPVVTPPKNTTLEFADTIGRLYLHHGDHRDLATKMVAFFKDHVRRKMHLKLIHLDHAEAKLLALKTGLDTDWTQSLLKECRHTTESATITEAALQQLHQKLEYFYDIAQIKKTG